MVRSCTGVAALTAVAGLVLGTAVSASAAERDAHTTDVWIASQPVVLATTTIPDTGTLTVTVEVPAGLEPGAHRICVTAPATVASAPLTIAVVGGGSGESGELAASESESPSGLVTIGILALCACFACVLVSRTRRRSGTRAG